MDDDRDFDEILGFGARLRMLAQLQGAYLDQLRDQGLDDEQAFTLLRDWSSRAYDWTLRPPAPTAAPAPPTASDQPRPDPSQADPAEPYLLSIDELERELRLLDDTPFGDADDVDQAA
jgi:hypothetical protein